MKRGERLLNYKENTFVVTGRNVTQPQQFCGGRLTSDVACVLENSENKLENAANRCQKTVLKSLSVFTELSYNAVQSVKCIKTSN